MLLYSAHVMVNTPAYIMAADTGCGACALSCFGSSSPAIHSLSLLLGSGMMFFPCEQSGCFCDVSVHGMMFTVAQRRAFPLRRPRRPDIRNARQSGLW